MSVIPSLSHASLPSLLSALTAQSPAGAHVAVHKTSVSANVSDGAQDRAELSPLGQFVAQLQNIQESHPSEYPSVLSQMATHLKTAADSAAQSGDPYAAAEYNTLVQDFTDAAQSGGLPNIQDLVQVFENQGGIPTFGLSPPAASPSANSSVAAVGTPATSQGEKLVANILQALYSNNEQNGSANPVRITLNTFQSSVSVIIG